MRNGDITKHPSIAMGDVLFGDIESTRGPANRSEWFRGAARMRLDVEPAAEAAGIDTDADGWWHEYCHALATGAAEHPTASEA